MVKIAIDARFYGTEHTGLGRYTTNVMAHLPQYLQGQTLKVLLRRKYYDTLKLPKNCEKILCDIPHYSLQEQLKLPRLLRSLAPTLLYTFHFNTSILSSIPTVVTVHDLIKSHFTSSDTTTHSAWLFALKRAGYNTVIRHTLSHALAVITPTNTVKNDILALFPSVAPERIHPIPEAPDAIFRSQSTINHQPSTIPQNYLLFVGNAYPHKNLSLLLQAIQQLKTYPLIIVSKNTPFLQKLLLNTNTSMIRIIEVASDAELKYLYQHARALVTPSLMEGYGLVGLEALMVGTPVIASNIPVYREVYGDKVTYFDPHSASSLISAIQSSTIDHRPSAIKLTRTWGDVAKSIAEVINESGARLR